MIVRTDLGIGSRGIALVMAMAMLASPVAAQTQARQASLSEAEVVGRYDYSDTQLAASVVLRADHSFAYEVIELAKPDLPQDRFRQRTRGGVGVERRPQDRPHQCPDDGTGADAGFGRFRSWCSRGANDRAG